MSEDQRYALCGECGTAYRSALEACPCKRPSAPTAPVDAITVKQDLGGPYPVYKEITLLLWADGTVTWEPPRKGSLEVDRG